MSNIKAAHKEDFEKDHKEISKSKTFISRLQMLESRVNKIEIYQPDGNTSPLQESIKIIKEYLEKMLRGNHNFSPAHWLHVKKNIANSTGPAQKKEIIKNEIQYLKNYINAKKGIYWDERNHTDILYIYWHSKTELKIVKKMTSCLKFLDQEISRLEKRRECYGNM